MAISNGYDVSRVNTALTGRLAWSGGSPKSGRFFEDFHPLCTKSNLKDVIEGGNSMDDTAFGAFLTGLEKSVILRALNGVFNESQQIESTLIFDRQLRNDIVTQNFGKFCGYRLFIAPGEFSAQISQASFVFDGAATFNLYLFQDMTKDPLKTKSITTKAFEEVAVSLDDWIIDYIGATQGGVYYLGYFQNDLGSVHALDEFVNRWNQSIAFGYTAFEAVAVGATDFVRIQVPYTYRTYGMNLEIQTYKNFTNRIAKNPSLFDELIGLTMAVTVLGYQAYSVRSNKEQRITQEMAGKIYDEINNLGNGMLNPWVAGIKKQIDREIKRVRENFLGTPGVVTSRPPIWTTGSLQGVLP